MGDRRENESGDSYGASMTGSRLAATSACNSESAGEYDTKP